MNLIFLGPPGAGKGTIANLVIQDLKVIQISTGDLLREAVKLGTELGKKAKGFMDKGELVPDTLVINLLQDRIARPDCAAGFILDGFPRTIPQAQALEAAGVKIDKVVNFNIDDALIVRRLSGRRVHKKTGKTYNVNPDGYPRPPADMPADELLQRDDDKAEAIQNRLTVYRRQTEPLIEHYGKKGQLVHIDATVDSGDIAAEVIKVVRSKK